MKKGAILLIFLTACFLFAAEDTYLQQARAILKTVPLIDGHNDLPWELRGRFNNRLSKVDLNDTSHLDPPLMTDIPRLRKGMVGGQFWSVYVPVEVKGSDAIRDVMEQIDVTKRFVEKYPGTFEMAYTAEDIERIFKKGKIASLIGVEGGHCINNSLAVLRQLYADGARYMTLTHTSNTDWADSSNDEPKHKGLTPFGREVVHEMNRLGMLVDLSHVSAQTMNQVLDIAEAPVIFSHSSYYGISNHPRNVPDDVLKRVAKNGGVVMVNFSPHFISKEVFEYRAVRDGEEARLKYAYTGNPDEEKKQFEQWQKDHPEPPVTAAQIADHIDAIRKLIGVDYIGVGSDYDGITSVPKGMEDVSHFPDLFAELLKRGYSKDDLRKIAGLNVLRVMKAVQTAAGRIQKVRPPSEARIEDLDKPSPNPLP